MPGHDSSVFYFIRVLALQKKLTMIEKRESDETAALENMVHLVEQNLELTTVSVWTCVLMMYDVGNEWNERGERKTNERRKKIRKNKESVNY